MQADRNVPPECQVLRRRGARRLRVQLLKFDDYEKDDYNTPRIAAVVKGGDDFEAYIGIVTDSKVLVEKIDGDKAQFISTYEKNTPEDVVYSAETPDDACKFIFDEGAFAEFEHPVCSVAAIFDGKWNISGLNPE